MILLSISIQYSYWLILPCLLIGTGVAALLYFRSSSFSEAPKWLINVLAALRWTVITALCLLLLSPVLKSLKTEIKKPLVVIAKDVSSSMGNKTANTQDINVDLEALSKELSTDFEVVSLSFGESVRPGLVDSFQDRISDISLVLDEIHNQYQDQNLGSVILATDGIYNTGSNPVYGAQQLNVPCFSIAYGDTIPRKDLILKRVFNNELVFLNNSFDIQIDMTAFNCSSQSTKLTVQKIGAGNSTVFSTSVSINNKDFFETFTATLKADVPGVQHYRISLTSVSGEATTVNNTKDIYVNVIDGRQKILLLADAPNPDLSAIRQALGDNLNYLIDLKYAADYSGIGTGYDLVILHGLPSSSHQINSLIDGLNKAKTPRWFILSGGMDLSTFNRLQNVMTIDGDGRTQNEAQAFLQSNFELFTFDPQLIGYTEQFPPLSSPFGNYKLSGNSKALMNQRIGNIETNYPLFAFGDFDGVKTAVLAGEKLWKWRLFDFLQHNNHNAINEIIDKTVQYLTVKTDKRPFRVISEKTVFQENETIKLDAELYNASYELINTPDVSLMIRNEQGKEYPFNFSRIGRYYELDAGYFPPGSYSFKALTNYNGAQLKVDGKFEIQAIQLEAFESTANHGLLRAMAQLSGGKTVMPDQVATLANEIKKQASMKPVLYQSNVTQPFIFLKWIFWILLLILTAEWFLRRYYGSY